MATSDLPREFVEQYRRAKEIGGTATVRLPFTTTFGAHRQIDTMRVQAVAEELEATHTHDGGMLERNHVLKVTGDSAKVVAFAYMVTGKLSTSWKEG